MEGSGGGSSDGVGASPEYGEAPEWEAEDKFLIRDDVYNDLTRSNYPWNHFKCVFSEDKPGEDQEWESLTDLVAGLRSIQRAVLKALVSLDGGLLALFILATANLMMFLFLFFQLERTHDTLIRRQCKLLMDWSCKLRKYIEEQGGGGGGGGGAVDGTTEMECQHAGMLCDIIADDEIQKKSGRQAGGRAPGSEVPSAPTAPQLQQQQQQQQQHQTKAANDQQVVNFVSDVPSSVKYERQSSATAIAEVHPTTKDRPRILRLQDRRTRPPMLRIPPSQRYQESPAVEYDGLVERVATRSSSSSSTGGGGGGGVSSSSRHNN